MGILDYTSKDVVRFWSKVNITSNPDDCWEWQTSKHYKDGYGQFSLRTKAVSAHRFSYELINGKINDGLWVLHKCDNPTCVNPNHLFLGTSQDNIDDMMQKGRHATGEKAAGHKLTADDVRYIRQRYAQGGVTTRELGEQMGVGSSTISRIIRRKKWKSIE